MSSRGDALRRLMSEGRAMSLSTSISPFSAASTCESAFATITMQIFSTEGPLTVSGSKSIPAACAAEQHSAKSAAHSSFFMKITSLFQCVYEKRACSSKQTLVLYRAMRSFFNCLQHR